MYAFSVLHDSFDGVAAGKRKSGHRAPSIRHPILRFGGTTTDDVPPFAWNRIPQHSQPSPTSNSPLEESAGPTMNDPAKEETLRDLEVSYDNIDRLASIPTGRTDSLNSTPTPKNRL